MLEIVLQFMRNALFSFIVSVTFGLLGTFEMARKKNYVPLLLKRFEILHESKIFYFCFTNGISECVSFSYLFDTK